MKKKDSKNWKSHINKHLYVTQSFNTDFASLLLKIKEEMDGYIKILDSYKNDEILKNNITSIKKDLEDMKSDFEIAYLPKQYLLNVNKMYLTP
ncbi:hypothetical protein H5J24_01875 [Chryseobacterium capnotolerans]|uniref:hypothetical protein n=1 Tax=Chryseobacterium capnotolerans TaxID=2759528 RepID=UPI001E40236A|nr:hypothetical protein [Chryseobacterium capnotolerans]UHO38949.1 hypothetical protein H5J24_01875 [Chryseobacterium capnotolerans]